MSILQIRVTNKSDIKRRIRLLAYAIAVIALIFLYGFLHFCYVSKHYNVSAPVGQTIDAVVVVTGSSGRIEEGFRLASICNTKLLLISGVGSDVSKQSLSKYLEKYDVGEQSVVLGYIAANTNENAKEAAMFMILNNLHSMILITTNIHMLRTYLIFKKQMPNYTIIPYPIKVRYSNISYFISAFIEYCKYVIELGASNLSYMDNVTSAYHTFILNIKAH